MKKLNNLAIVVFGVLMIALAPACLWGSSVFDEELSRWQGARTIQEAGELANLAQGSEAVITGSIPSDAEAPREGFALFQVWKLTYGAGESRRKWRVQSVQPPTFELRLDRQGVQVRSAGATLYKGREVRVSGDEKLKGFEPGSEITVLGTLSASQVQAEVICGGGRETCFRQLSSPSAVLIAVAVVLVLGGVALIWFGLRRIRGGGRAARGSRARA